MGVIVKPVEEPETLIFAPKLCLMPQRGRWHLNFRIRRRNKSCAWRYCLFSPAKLKFMRPRRLRRHKKSKSGTKLKVWASQRAFVPPYSAAPTDGAKVRRRQCLKVRHLRSMPVFRPSDDRCPNLGRRMSRQWAAAWPSFDCSSES